MGFCGKLAGLIVDEGSIVTGLNGKSSGILAFSGPAFSGTTLFDVSGRGLVILCKSIADTLASSHDMVVVCVLLLAGDPNSVFPGFWGFESGHVGLTGGPLLGVFIRLGFCVKMWVKKLRFCGGTGGPLGGC